MNETEWNGMGVMTMKIELETVNLTGIEKARAEWFAYRRTGGKLADYLLTTSAKTEKDNIGYFTKILYLEPADKSGVNLCINAGQCKKICLEDSGHMGMENQRCEKNGQKSARWKRTRYFLAEKINFERDLIAEIVKHIVFCQKNNLKPVIRLNGTSDISWDHIIKMFPMVQFYDYTKVYRRYEQYLNANKLRNYHITFSADENTNLSEWFKDRKRGTIAIVFDKNSFKAIVSRGFVELNGKKIPVINGDLSDNRFLDKPKLAIVALLAKGKARKCNLEFIRHYYDQTGMIV